MSCNCNDCQDEHSETEDADFEEYVPPTWRDAEVANEVQAKAWGEIVNGLYDEHKVKAIPLQVVVSLTAQRCNVRAENWTMVTLQIERFVRESPSFELRKGKSGGVYRKEVAQPVASIKLVKMLGVPDMITGKLEDDYTCGCGNTKCNKTEKSCWKCGTAIKP